MCKKSALPLFAKGVIKFEKEVYAEHKALFTKLAKGQKPEALFIACSDARVETAMITQTDPGDLFICRNAGNIVPPHEPHTGGVTASIEFAVAALEVKHIVICGHSDCGAMHGALHPERVEQLPHIREWLGYAQEAVDRAKALASSEDPKQIMSLLLEQNIILQLEHLKSHPCVAQRLQTGDLTLHGWIYDIATGEVFALNSEDGIFQPVATHYQE
ncbi:MAG: carbonic anhydrase [bacterium]